MAYLARMEIRIPPQTVDELRLLASERDLSLAALARYVLVKGVKRERAIQDRRRKKERGVRLHMNSGTRTVTAYREMGIPADE